MINVIIVLIMKNNMTLSLLGHLVEVIKNIFPSIKYNHALCVVLRFLQQSGSILCIMYIFSCLLLCLSVHFLYLSGGPSRYVHQTFSRLILFILILFIFFQKRRSISHGQILQSVTTS
jgi:hypothetical protein